ncbi:hypothetical protein AG4045_024914 [Apium graveolens]|uniref:PHD finger protein ALFIN-LIKE n=1 Tax=Apium graveolens TaxID=4045 RepID=A0A6L5BAU6_APIGR|nr:hypothetical protein AG4045_024914 [Apium graveolens]
MAAMREMILSIADIEEIYRKCKPGAKELIYLRGRPSKQWEIREFQGGKDLKSRVSGEALKLSFGINVFRKLMAKDEWLSFISVSGDEWLKSFAFFFADQYGFDQANR